MVRHCDVAGVWGESLNCASLTVGCTAVEILPGEGGQGEILPGGQGGRASAKKGKTRHSLGKLRHKTRSHSGPCNASKCTHICVFCQKARRQMLTMPFMKCMEMCQFTRIAMT